MSTEDITQIKIDRHSIGILGLKTVFEEIACQFSDKPYDAVQEELLRRLSKNNYILDNVKNAYAKAFLREFKKYLGESFVEEAPHGLQVKVLDQGCTQCDRLEKDLMSVMTELNLMGNIDHVREIKEIGKYGAMGTPALLINGRVKSVGKEPPKSKLIEWLKEAEKEGKKIKVCKEDNYGNQSIRTWVPQV